MYKFDIFIFLYKLKAGRSPTCHSHYGDGTPADTRLFALNARLELKPEKTAKANLLIAMKNKIIEEAKLIGLYEKLKP